MSIPKGNTAHLLYGDLYYKIPFISSFLLQRNKMIVTMHSCPKGKMKHWLMKNFCHRVKHIIVHSRYILKQMNAIGIKNVSYIDYPSFYDYSKLPAKSEIRSIYGISQDKIVLSALGGIRKDKGLDILLESFQYLRKEVKDKIILNIAGVSYKSFLQEQDIQERCHRYAIPNRLIVRPLTEKEFMENVLVTDYMVMPYRGNMTGNSGPMTEAIVNHIPSIVPRQSNLGAICQQFNVGLVFEQENPKSLASIIEKAVLTSNKYDFSYADRLKEESFLQSHETLYESFS